MTMDAVEIDPAKKTSVEPPAPGIRVGGSEATSRNKEHFFYAATKNSGTVLAIIWLFTQPTGPLNLLCGQRGGQRHRDSPLST